jgi:serine-type D-Ala-D-Ala carboxypeptidase/endopeptidase
MKRTRRYCACVITTALWAGMAGAAVHGAGEQQATARTDAEIRQVLVERIATLPKGAGIVVGLITPEGRRIIAAGGEGAPRPLDGDTVFEIGSVTKVFTSLLFADAVGRGEVALDDPLAQHLKARVPQKDGRPIALVDLATNTSGFPFWPTNFPPVAETAAYAGYTVDRLHEFLSTFELPRTPGSQWEYSNMNGGLLGFAVASRAGTDYETLLRARVLLPLGMKSTAITLTPAMESNLIAGRSARLPVAPPWVVPEFFVGGGALRSSANDLLTFLSASIGITPSPLAPAMTAMLRTRRPALGFQQALGWWVLGEGQGDAGIVTHDGGTFGYASSIAYDPASRTGVVVLSSASGSVSDIGRHLLRASFPLTKPAAAKPRTEITVDPSLFDAYAGQYRLGPGALVTIAREADTLTIQLPSAPKLRLRAETTRDYFIAESPQTTFSFEVDSSGSAVRLLLKSAAGELSAVRVGTR